MGYLQMLLLVKMAEYEPIKKSGRTDHIVYCFNNGFFLA